MMKEMAFFYSVVLYGKYVFTTIEIFGFYLYFLNSS
jgi:hypothetical protein